VLNLVVCDWLFWPACQHWFCIYIWCVFAVLRSGLTTIEIKWLLLLLLLLARQIQSIKLTRTFMKLFRVLNHQVRLMSVELILVFSLLRVRYISVGLLLVFLQKFIALENSLCTLVANDARRQLHSLTFLSNLKLILKLYISCVILFILNFLITFSAG